MTQEGFLCFTNSADVDAIHHAQHRQDVVGTSFNGGVGGSQAHLIRSFMFNLSTLKSKVNDVESVAMQAAGYCDYHAQPVDQLTLSMAFSSLASLMLEIVQMASMMMLSSEEMAVGRSDSGTSHTRSGQELQAVQMHDGGLFQSSVSEVNKGSNNHGLFGGDAVYNWNTHEIITCNNSSSRASISKKCTTRTGSTTMEAATAMEEERNFNDCQGRKNMNQERALSPEAYDVVELEAADLLARYTHYCQVCGRGFKRDANLRMHMRAHGDKYKSSLISNPIKSSCEENKTTRQRHKYSCPQEGCRWNKNHVKFQPLKSIVCVKNHYKRSHCPKMFLCKRCNAKQFAVLSDLKMHEKYCGNIKWHCSCGTTFLKKDKLMDHVALFVDHTPLIQPLVINLDNRFHNNQHEGVHTANLFP